MGVDTLRLANPTPASVARPEVSLIVPAYNEAGSARADAFRSMLDGSLATLEREVPGAYELLVVDDGSTDRTAAIAHEFGVAVHTHPDRSNRGKGASVRLGMLEAKGAYRVFADADGSYGPDAVMGLADKIGGAADVAVAFREQGGHASSLRGFGHVALERICDVIAPSDAVDTQAGAKAFTAEAAEAIWPLVKADRYAADRQAMHLVHRLGYRVANVPTDIKVVPGSHVHMVRDTARILVDATRLSRFHTRALTN
ncbi:glycosyltransferase [Candidatus Saccharibacteria bacterium]|nr:glycosyltransferase [Candidatus Saccharibacteria bacterium]